MRDKLALERRERAIAGLAGRQHGVISAGQLAELGFDRDAIARRVRAGRLHRVRRGVYAVGHTALGVSGHRLAAVLTIGGDAVASHVTAAAVWELRATGSALQHVTTARGPRSRPGIRVHHWPLHAADSTVRAGIPVTSLARTLVDLGGVVPAAQVRNAFVRAEQLRLLDVKKIDAALARGGRRRGPAVLRELLRVYDPRWQETRSPLEIAMLDLSTAHGLPEPEVNAWIADRFLVDFLWRDAALIVETDGDEVHGTATAMRDDARRDHALGRIGYHVLRVRMSALRHHEPSVAAAVQAALAQATTTTA